MEMHRKVILERNNNPCNGSEEDLDITGIGYLRRLDITMYGKFSSILEQDEETFNWASTILKNLV